MQKQNQLPIITQDDVLKVSNNRITAKLLKSDFHHINKIFRKNLENDEDFEVEFFENGDKSEVRKCRAVSEEKEYFLISMLDSENEENSSKNSQMKRTNSEKNIPPKKKQKICDDDDDFEPSQELVPKTWIETVFKGICYRSKLEAQTAYFMTCLGIQYFYEVCTLNLPDGSTYTPDFWLPEQNLLIEVKPHYPHIEEIRKCELVSECGFNIVIMYGTIDAPFSFEQTNGRRYLHKNSARGMFWKSTGERCPGEYVWVENANGKFEIAPFLHSQNADWNSEKLLSSYEKAKLYNFCE